MTPPVPRTVITPSELPLLCAIAASVASTAMQVYASSLDCRGTNQLQTSLRLGDQTV